MWNYLLNFITTIERQREFKEIKTCIFLLNKDTFCAFIPIIHFSDLFKINCYKDTIISRGKENEKTDSLVQFQGRALCRDTIKY